MMTKQQRRKQNKKARKLDIRKQINKLKARDLLERKQTSAQHSEVFPAPTSTSKIKVPCKRRNYYAPINRYDHKEKTMGTSSHVIHQKAGYAATQKQRVQKVVIGTYGIFILSDLKKPFCGTAGFMIGACKMEPGDRFNLAARGQAIWTPVRYDWDTEGEESSYSVFADGYLETSYFHQDDEPVLGHQYATVGSCARRKFDHTLPCGNSGTAPTIANGFETDPRIPINPIQGEMKETPRNNRIKVETTPTQLGTYTEPTDQADENTYQIQRTIDASCMTMVQRVVFSNYINRTEG